MRFGFSFVTLVWFNVNPCWSDVMKGENVLLQISASNSLVYAIELRFFLLRWMHRLAGFTVLARVLFTSLMYSCNLVTFYMLKPVALLINHLWAPTFYCTLLGWGGSVLMFSFCIPCFSIGRVAWMDWSC
jgi:hypothetical protein